MDRRLVNRKQRQLHFTPTARNTVPSLSPDTNYLGKFPIGQLLPAMVLGAEDGVVAAKKNPKPWR